MSTDTIQIVLHGDAPVVIPRAGCWAPFVMRPGVVTMGLDHWDAVCAASSEDAEAFQKASAAGLLGPVDSTPKPKPRNPVEMFRAMAKEGQEKARLAALEPEPVQEPEPAPEPVQEPEPEVVAAMLEALPEETTVTFDIPDEPEPEPKPKAKRARKPKGK